MAIHASTFLVPWARIGHRASERVGVLVSATIEDVVAMDEAAEWFAYPKALGRSAAMAAVARSASNVGYYNWPETISTFRVRAGYMREWDDSLPGGWFEFCDADSPDAFPVWVVATKRWWDS